LYLLAGVAGAIAIHTGFNLSIINASASDTLKTFGWIWGAVVILIVLFEEVKAVKPRNGTIIKIGEDLVEEVSVS
jgi:hypothetical protein